MNPDACSHWALAQQPSAVAKLHVWMMGLLLVRLRSRVVIAAALEFSGVPGPSSK